VTGASLGTRAGEVSSVRGTRSLVEQARSNSEFTAGIQSFTVEDDGNGDATWGGVVAVVLPWDPSQVATLSLGRERVYAAGYGLMSATPGDGTQGYGVRTFGPGEPATCGPPEQPEYACPGLAVLAAEGCGAATCGPLWEAAAGGVPTGQPAVAGGVVYVGTDTGAVDGFHAAGCGAPACAPLWSTGLGSEITAGPIVAGGKLTVGTADGRLVTFRPTSAG